MAASDWFTADFPTTGQGNFNRYMPAAYPGLLNGMGTFQMIPAINNLATYDTWTLTPPGTVDNSTAYSVTVNGFTASFTTDASATATELMTGLLADIKTDVGIYSLVDATIAANVITLIARTGRVSLAVSVATSMTNDIVLANTATPTTNAIIPFGRFVGRKSAYAQNTLDGTSTATLVDHVSNYTVLGVTMASHTVERQGIGYDAVEGYQYGTTMDVLKNIGTCKGVWVECVDSTIAIGDTPYIAVAGNNKGKLSNVSTGNVAATSYMKILSAAQATFGDRYVAMIQLTL